MSSGGDEVLDDPGRRSAAGDPDPGRDPAVSANEPPFITRPGPRSIPPDEMPGGVVIHVYSVPTCRLLLVRHVHHPDDVERHAEADAALTDSLLWPDDIGVCLVAYDGDTGERMPWRG